MAVKNPTEPFTRISVEEAKAKLDADEAVMVDVRSPDEYVQVHAPSVRLIPVNAVLSELKQIRQFADGKEVLFICKTGARSALAAEYASAGGMTDVPLSNVEGGMVAWVSAGFPIGD